MMRISRIEWILCLSLFFSFVNTGLSQENFKNGYIIQASGDTITGFIDWREGLRAYKICHFKLLDSHDVAVYGPDDIKGYGLINGRAFETRKITNANGIKKVVFLDVKVVGLVSLYKYEHSLFVQKTGDSLQRISNGKSEQLMNGKLIMRYSNQHIIVLSTMLFDCVALRERTQKVPFVERNITTLLEDYNACKGSGNVTVNAAKPWAKVMVGLTGGLNLSSLEVESGALRYDQLAGKYDVTKTPFIGVSFDVLSPRISDRFSFHGAMLYMHPTYRLENRQRYSLSTHFNQVEINSNQLKIPVGMRYTFLGEKVVPYINVGISTTINFASSSSWDEQIKYTTSVENNHYTDVWQMRTNQMGYWGGFGIALSLNTKLGAFIEIRFEQTQSLSNFTAMASGVYSEVKNVQFIVGIRKK